MLPPDADIERFGMSRKTSTDSIARIDSQSIGDGRNPVGFRVSLDPIEAVFT